MIAPGRRPLTVKLILPALTEATSPFFRPIQYSLFPPLGLATLAASLAPDDRATIVDEHVEILRTDDAPGLGTPPARSPPYRPRGAVMTMRPTSTGPMGV